MYLSATSAAGSQPSRCIISAACWRTRRPPPLFHPYSLAPARAMWARDNRGVMIRVLGQPGDAATHLENRVGEPAANPYLYMASQIYAGLDGIAQKSDPGPSADAPYETEAT